MKCIKKALPVLSDSNRYLPKIINSKTKFILIPRMIYIRQPQCWSWHETWVSFFWDHKFQNQILIPRNSKTKCLFHGLFLLGNKVLGVHTVILPVWTLNKWAFLVLPFVFLGIDQHQKQKEFFNFGEGLLSHPSPFWKIDKMALFNPWHFLTPA